VAALYGINMNSAFLESQTMPDLKPNLACMLFLLLVPFPAHAYVDPGSGTLLLQLIAAAGVGAMFYFRQVRDKIKSILFGGEKAETKSDTSDDKIQQISSDK
jgi:hypothetical protein